MIHVGPINRRDLLGVASLAWLGSPGAHAADATFPIRPLRLIVPAAAAGVQDVRSRQLAGHLGRLLRQQVVVENRPGATGAIALELVSRAAADGYTLVMAPVSLTVLPHLVKLSFDPLRDLAAVTLISTGPIMLLANPAAPFDSIASLVAIARDQPGRINVGSAGHAGMGHLALELLNREAGLGLVNVPYTGGAQQVTDLLGNQIPLLFDYPGSVATHVRSGRMRALAVAGTRRLPLLPDVPTFAEAGFPSVVVTGWQGIMVPAGTPNEVIQLLHGTISSALQSADLREAFIAAGVEIGGDGPEAFGGFIRAEHARWGEVIARAGIKLEQ